MPHTGPIISIEDDEDDQFLIQTALKDCGVRNEIRFFGDGESALQYLQTTPEQPFLILCDINMPLMNGRELRKRINESEYLYRKTIPFIFLTTSSEPDLVEEAYKQSVQGYYKKSGDPANMARQLKAIIDYWRYSLRPTGR